MDQTSNILAHRYASPEMRAIWSLRNRFMRERRIWVACLRAQKEMGLDIPDAAIKAYESHIEKIDLDSIERRERRLRHDVKARIEEFSAQSGYELIHRGLTGRDITDNVELLQIQDSLSLIKSRAIALLFCFGKKIRQYRALPLIARTHNVPAQITTLGRRFTMFAQEILSGLEKIVATLDNFKLRGFSGPVGTGSDLATLFPNIENASDALTHRTFSTFGDHCYYQSTGQAYPRSDDLSFYAGVLQVGSGISNFALTLRLMAGLQLADEGFTNEQAGSSAMPHKINARTCERISGFQTLLRGYAGMANELAGNQWNEGDVSCSVVRRIILPDTFYTIDASINSAITVLTDLNIYEARLAAEMRTQLPFVASSLMLLKLQERGMGREEAHRLISVHSTKTLLSEESGSSFVTSLIEASGGRFSPQDYTDIETAMLSTLDPCKRQTDEFIAKLDALLESRPADCAYTPPPVI